MEVQEIEYLPADINGYRYTDNKMYISKLLIKDNEILNAKRVFLEYLVKGTMNLYYYRDKNKDEHYYVEKENIALKELIEEKKEGYKDGRIAIITNNKWVYCQIL